jgi:hypothetical protein
MYLHVQVIALTWMPPNGLAASLALPLHLSADPILASLSKSVPSTIDTEFIFRERMTDLRI